jgi:8-oxo-dGTP pyrophosphatase MutT (NUDIX family)
VAATIRHLQEGTDMPTENLFEAMSPERANYLASLPRKRVAAGAVFSDQHGRTLLVAPTYRPYWQLPGGVVEADESPLTAATREVREELGLPLPGRLLAVDWVAPAPGRIEGLLLVYDGGTLADEQAHAADELVDRLPAHMLKRIQAALQARTDGSTSYLENGSAA